MDSSMYKMATLCLCVIFLMGCNKKPEDIVEETIKVSEVDFSQQQKQSLLEEFSGVWSDNNELMTFYYDGTAVHLIIDDEAKEVKLGDIDLQNETINLLVTKIENYEQGIITLRRVWNEAKTEFTLNFTGFDGSNIPLGFVRKIGNDDKTRIENIYTHQINHAYEAEDPSTPAYDVSTAEDYTDADYDTEHYREDDLIEVDRTETEIASIAASAADNAQIASQAADSAAQAAYEATQAAMDVENN